MAGERWGRITFDGVGGVEGGSYTVSQGLTPGVAVIRCQPGTLFRIGQRGNLVITDGVGTVVAPDCKVESMEAVIGADGQYIDVRLKDRRWKWLELGAISGQYNQLDPHGKLILWTVRSPEQLARLCLEAAGEAASFIDLPPGLEGPIEAPDFLPPGENVPPTTTNPPTNWYAEPPMQALQRLCDQYGRRIVYRLDTDTVMIVRPGVGGPLPDGSLYSVSPSLALPDKPDAVVCVGSPVRFQGRFLLQAVGEEWDGTLKPIESLSYCPRVGAKPQKVRIKLVANGTQSRDWRIKVGGIEFFRNESTDAVAGIAARFAADINAATQCVATAVALFEADVAYIDLTGKYQAEQYSVSTSVELPGGAGGNPRAGASHWITQVAAEGKATWAFCPPPLFPLAPDFRHDRLTREEAVRLSQKSVWRYYRLINLDVSGEGPINVPGYGTVRRQQQVFLLPTKVDQVVPEAIDLNFETRDGLKLINNYYNGYSRDLPAEVFGSVDGYMHNATYIARASIITRPTDKVHVDFTIDPEYQLVIFSLPVYTRDDGRDARDLLNNQGLGRIDGIEPKNWTGAIVEPRLVLETSCHVRDPDNNQFIAYVKGAATFGEPLGTSAFAQVHDDVQLNVTADYDDKGRFSNVRLLEADPVVRAQYYIDGMLLQYPQVQGLTNGYNGIVPVYLDGAVAQVTWSVGGSGCTTTASANTEHHPAVPPYPARRRAEMLPPNNAMRLLDDAFAQDVASKQMQDAGLKKARDRR